MIEFKKKRLDNGLSVVVHTDNSTPLVAVNLLYKVGSINEHHERTGFAHLFEHLMFSGSKNALDYDGIVQNAGGECNAFTNTDITNFYTTLPADNIETALWLEADRMQWLNINEKSLAVQQKVVIEEFKEVCLNQPFGDVWHHISGLAYQQHPYRWPTIGLSFKHIEEASLEDVQLFYSKFYSPNNAVLVLSGKIEAEKGFDLAEKWFADIPPSDYKKPSIPQEAIVGQKKTKAIHSDIPMDALYMAFRMPKRNHPDYHAYDLLSDILSNGDSSRLYRKLKKEQKLFVDIDAYIMGNIEPGLFVIEGRLTKGISHEVAEAGVWALLKTLQEELVLERELLKIKNKVESALVFGECSILNKAMNLAFYEMLGDASLINQEAERYDAVSAEDIKRVANDAFQSERLVVLRYFQKEGSE